MRTAGFASLVLLAAAGCSPAETNYPPISGAGGGTGQGGSADGFGGGSGTGNGGGSTGAGGALSGVDAGGGTTNCTTAATLVYVLSVDNSIWSFEPQSQSFTELFTLDCPTPLDGNTWGPNSMAVDRDVTAWVNYVGTDSSGTDQAGEIFKVDINAHTCAPAPAVTLPSEWYRLGMGFAADVPGGAAETLYITGTGVEGGATSPGLGRVSTTGAVVAIGQFSGDSLLTGQSAELTGTGAAQLYGFFTTSPVRVAQLDMVTGGVVSDLPVAGVPTPLDWAFSFWGGAFYLYTSGGSFNSTVTRFDPTTKAVDTSYDVTAPTIIVGAGVSICAPITPPT